MRNKSNFWNLDKIRISILFNIALTINLFILAFMYMNVVNKGVEDKKRIELLESDIRSIQIEYESMLNNKDKDVKLMQDAYNELYEVSVSVNKYNKELLDDNIQLEKDNLTLIDENTLLADKVNVYETYKIFMYRDNYSGRRTDCDYDTLLYLQSLIEDKDVNNLPFYCSWIMIESTWNNHDKNPTSTANGLPQFLNGTGKWVYTQLGYDPSTYVHDEIVTKPEYSLPMMVYYVNDMLMETYQGDLHDVIDSYRGLHDTPYLNKFNKYLSYFGTSIDQVAEESMERYYKRHSPVG